MSDKQNIIESNGNRSLAIKECLRTVGIEIPQIMLPNHTIDLKKWAVVACDQYTSQRSYWKAVEDEVGDSPSTLHMVFPEVYLEDSDKDQRIINISSAMNEYMERNLLESLLPSFVYVERTLATGTRKGLMIALDLEQYDYKEGSQSLIRSTEGTVLDRLPPRIAIRKDALLETPHIMVLIDDPGKTVIEPIVEKISESDKLYDFDLMMNGGHIAGYRVERLEAIEGIANGLSKLADPQLFRQKYDVSEDIDVLLFAMGDGNHSFATAKACWDNIKDGLSEEEKQNHPARFALVELVNVHDEAMLFEPIHRVLFEVDPKHVLQSMQAYYNETEQLFEYESFASKEKMLGHYEEYLQIYSDTHCTHLIPYNFLGEWGILKISQAKSNIEAGTLQAFIDDYLSNNPEATVDYIHGDEITEELGSQEGNMGFLLPNMNKNDLFKTVIMDGALPRKTFSMGEAHEKRYYLECRKIIKE
ncbi:MAG: DUF1015 domain-containing protein [Clostridiales bacterium]|nr:DUF1015 domain-containing protein [Clostridiales bacterium]